MKNDKKKKKKKNKTKQIKIKKWTYLRKFNCMQLPTTSRNKTAPKNRSAERFNLEASVKLRFTTACGTKLQN
jgi:hypothetical protein